MYSLINSRERKPTCIRVDYPSFLPVNAITQFVDHQMGNQKNRLASAWFGVGSKLKQEAFETALKMAA